MSMKSRNPYRSDQLTGRYPSRSDNQQFSVRVDPIQGDIDEEISGLHDKVRGLKNVAQLIEGEAKYQNELLNQLESVMIKAQAGVSNGLRRLNRDIIKNGSNHLTHVILFVFACVAFIVIWSKFFRSK